MSLFGKIKSRYKEMLIKTLSKDSNHTDSRNLAETYLCTCRKAAMTAETAVVLPLFVGFMVFFMFCFRMMEVETGMRQAMAYAVRVMAASSGEAAEKISPGKMRLLLMTRIRKEGVPLQYIDGGSRGISMKDSDFHGSDLILHVSYRMTVPIGFFGKLSYPVEQEINSRKWSGREEGERGESDSRYVYVTGTGRAYHINRECPYLDLSIRTVVLAEVKHLRNKEGSRYRKCGSCSNGDGSSKVCYVTDYGECYHRDLRCSGLKRTICLIRLKQVGNRHKCKKCMGG